MPEETKKTKKKLTVEEQSTQLTKASRVAGASGKTGTKAAETAAKAPAKAPAKASSKIIPITKKPMVQMDPDFPLRYIFAGFCTVVLLIFACVFFADGGLILQWIVNVFTGLLGRNDP